MVSVSLNPFVSSSEILRLIGVYKTLDMHCRPSELLEIEDAYTAFCFDEAFAYILRELQDGKKPVAKIQNDTKKSYKKPSDFYKKFDD
jgi:hypothetical protein